MKTQIRTIRSGTIKRRGVPLAAQFPAAEAGPGRIRIRLSESGIRQTFAARSPGFGFAIPGFGARLWFQ